MGLFTSGPPSAYPVLVKKEEQKRKRVQFQESLRREHWATSQSLQGFKLWCGKCEKRIQEELSPLFIGPNALWLRPSWRERPLMRVPIRVIAHLVSLPVGMVAYFALYVFIYPVAAIVKLGPTYFRFLRIQSKELANFDKRVQDEKAREFNLKKEEETKKQLRVEELEQKKEEEKAKQLVVAWVKECQTFSSETLLEHWAVLQQFPLDHYIYFMLEGSPGPIIREIVDREVTNRAISVEARQLALLRFENKRASISQAKITQETAMAQRDAQENQLGLMNGFMAMALIHLYK